VADRALHEAKGSAKGAWGWGALSATTAQTAKVAAIAIIVPRPTILCCSRMLHRGTPARSGAPPSSTAFVLDRLDCGRICGMQAEALAIAANPGVHTGARTFSVARMPTPAPCLTCLASGPASWRPEIPLTT